MSTYGIYHSGLGALGQSAKVDQIANNLANLSTPGFRADTISFSERLVEALEDRPDLQYYNAQIHRHGGAPFIAGTAFDRESGILESTGRELDFALGADGFFMVQDPQTEQVFYTRAGNFRTSPDGTLVTADGRYQAISADGRTLTFDPTNAGKIRLAEDGAIFQGTLEIGRLGVAEFEDYSRLVKRGDNLFENRGSGLVDAPEVKALQGTLERSSVNPLLEMTEMIKALRAVQTNLEMLRFQDQTLERTVNEYGRPQR